MFELEKKLPPTERPIRLDTRKGNPIENAVAPQPSAKHMKDYERERRKQGAAWTNRKPACGDYNCHGLAFAARRTAIYPDPEVWKLLQEDGYRKLEGNESVEPDDVVLYFSAKGEILHTARVLRVAALETGENDTARQKHVNLALSKWGPSWGEDVHSVRQVGRIAETWTDFIFQVWTDRPR